MIEVGTKVRVVKGARSNGGTLVWDNSMDDFVGKATVVIMNHDKDDRGTIYDLDPAVTGNYGFYEEWLEVIE